LSICSSPRRRRQFARPSARPQEAAFLLLILPHPRSSWTRFETR
jgi:hypothetical protein